MCNEKNGDTQIPAPKKFKGFKKLISSFCCKAYLENVENVIFER